MATVQTAGSIPQPINVDHHTLDAVSNGTFYDPHAVLGVHPHGDSEPWVTIRVLRPLAQTVTIITQDGSYEAQHEFNGIFTAVIPGISVNA